MSRDRFVSYDSVDDYTEERPSWASPVAPEDPEPNLRSLECASISVQIINTELVSGHIVYSILVESGISTWTVARRYRDFGYLANIFKENFASEHVLPALPPKRIFGSTEADFVGERKQQLELYLQALVPLEFIWERNDYALFLDNKNSPMMFLWNFQRMRKLQDVRTT